MRVITTAAVVRCGHDAAVANKASHDWVRIATAPILVEPDPQGRSISGCPNIGVNLKPCTATLAVRSGYSELIRIDGHRVATDAVVGFTDGTPPMAVDYTVRDPGQRWVGVDA